ncbi:MAG: sulfite exporter TauE/SafE family protein [Clostridia bacterium]|nr:sulfite exporter TauE/SafE family protein [Clostridia bacterium]
MRYVLLVCFGLIAGVAGGMGMGGGTLLIPLLSFANVSQQTAQAVNLISFIPMAVVALIFHIKNKLVDFKGILYMILPGAVAALGFSLLAGKMSGELLRRIFGGFLIVLSGVQFFATKLAKIGQK